jgi:hypothetical protein
MLVRRTGLEGSMTQTYDSDQIDEALAIIDRGLREMVARELVSTAEVSDLLLDVRTLLTHSAEPVPASVS